MTSQLFNKTFTSIKRFETTQGIHQKLLKFMLRVYTKASTKNCLKVHKLRGIIVCKSLAPEDTVYCPIVDAGLRNLDQHQLADYP